MKLNQQFKKAANGLLLLALLIPNGALAIDSTPANPVPKDILPIGDQTQYSPTRNILDSSLPQSVTNKLFEQYGEAYGAYVVVRQKQWEDDRIACAEDVNDFLYNYMKRGRGDTPSTEWSELLQPNIFQNRTGPWNDFDGDSQINSLPQSKDYDKTDGISFKGDFDDWYDFGVPNKYNPLLQYVKDKYGITDGMMPILQFLASEKMVVDEDDDGDSIVDGQDPYPYFATYGDADLNRNDIGPTDMYYRLLDGVNPPKTNADLGRGLNYLLDGRNIFDGSYSGIDYAEIGKPDIGNPQQTVAEVGPLLLFSYNSSAALKQVRTFTAQTAYETEEIKKILVDNCVRMADLQGILGRLEFKELIADRVGREIASEQIKQDTKAIVKTLNNNYDSNGDREPDAAQYFDRKNDFPNEFGLTAINISDEYDTSNNPDLINAKNLVILNLVGEQNKKNNNNNSLTVEEKETFVAIQNGNNNLAKQNKNQPTTFLAKLSHYFRAAVGPTSGTQNSVLSQEDAASFWKILTKITDFNSPNNPASALMIATEDITGRLTQRQKELEQEYLANQGFKSYRECQIYTPDGQCEQWATIPGSITRERVINQLNADTNQKTNVDESQDLTPNQ